jgi:tripeptide aminopeptidase
VKEDDAGSHYNGNCGNLYAFRKGELSGEPLLFSMHMDTVEPSKGKEAMLLADGTIVSKGDTVLGADDMSGMAAALEALEEIREENTPCRSLEFLITIGEERHLRGSAWFDFEQLKAKEGYTLDLTGEVGTAAIKAPSLATFQATFQGKAAHAGFAPEEGIHAIALAAKAIARIELGHVGSDMTVNVGTIQGGMATNIVPDSCRIQGEIRGFSHEAVLSQLEKIEEICKQEAESFGGSVTYETEVCFQAYETPEGHPAIERFCRACQANQITPKLAGTFGGSDQHRLAAHGIRGAVLASAMHQCHSCEEYTTVREMEQVCSLVKTLMCDPL